MVNTLWELVSTGCTLVDAHWMRRGQAHRPHQHEQHNHREVRCVTVSRLGRRRRARMARALRYMTAPTVSHSGVRLYSLSGPDRRVRGVIIGRRIRAGARDRPGAGASEHRIHELYERAAGAALAATSERHCCVHSPSGPAVARGSRPDHAPGRPGAYRPPRSLLGGRPYWCPAFIKSQVGGTGGHVVPIELGKRGRPCAVRRCPRRALRPSTEVRKRRSVRVARAWRCPRRRSQCGEHARPPTIRCPRGSVRT